MLLATNYLSKKKYLKYKAKGVNVFLFNEIDFSTIGLNSDTFLNCNSEKVLSTWYTWNENDKLLQSFKIKYPQFFNWKGYDMTLVFQKMLFWMNYKTGYLWYCRNKYYPDDEICHIDPLHPYSVFKSSLRYFKFRFTAKKITQVHAGIRDNGKSAGIHLKDDFELSIFDHFIREASYTGQFRLFLENNPGREKIRKSGLGKGNVTFISSHYPVFNFPSIDLKKVSGGEWYILTGLFRHWKIINKWVSKAERIAGSGITRLVVNEAENGIYGACFGEVMKNHGVKVYNTMNGLKAGQAQDAFINFDKWFVWDEQMKKMLVDVCGLDESKLVVKGHLMEDFVRNYTYQGELKIDTDLIKGKKVISVFSVKAKREAKLSTLNFLYDLVKNDDSYFLIVRPHPLEKREDYVLPDFESERIYWVNYSHHDSKTTLYDQILISDVSVVFGSTVALECKWFMKPCISIEPRENSLLYFADDKNVVHVNNLASFKIEFEKMVLRGQNPRPLMPSKDVAVEMIEYINQ